MMVAPRQDNKQAAPRSLKVVFLPNDSDEEDKSVSFDGVSLQFKRGVPRVCGEALGIGLLRQSEKFKPAPDDPAAVAVAAQLDTERKDLAARAYYGDLVAQGVPAEEAKVKAFPGGIPADLVATSAPAPAPTPTKEN